MLIIPTFRGRKHRIWSLITEHTLRGGNTSHGEILSRAMELCSKETGVCEWPDVPEKYWAHAVNEIIGL